MPELRHLRLWDGHEDRGYARITWEDGTFVGVEPDTAPPGRHALAVIPGLIDTHTHMASYAGSGSVDYRTWPLITHDTTRVLHAYANVRRALQVGVTTLRDMEADWCQVSLRDALDQELMPGPRILAFGMVSMTAGHADLFTPPAVPHRPILPADGPDAVRKRVREFARMTMDGIKIATGGGVLSLGDKPAWRNYTHEENDAIVDEAHALGLPVAAHAHEPKAIDAALRATVDSIEHGTLITVDQAIELHQRNMTIAPTILINDRIANGTAEVPMPIRQKAQNLVESRNQSLHRAHQHGAQFVLGTDSSGSLMPFGLQWQEIAAMQAAIGLTRVQALQAATSAAAKTIGWGDRLGQIKPGFWADFVIMHGTPWEDSAIDRAQQIVAVIVRGRLVHGTLAW